MVFGVGPHLSVARERGGCQFRPVTPRIGAGTRSRGKDHRGTVGAFGADQRVGLGGGEPALDGRNTFSRSHAVQCSGVTGGSLHDESRRGSRPVVAQEFVIPAFVASSVIFLLGSIHIC